MMGIYQILNTKNNKVYIGSSTDVEKRLKQHKQRLEKGKHHSYKLQMDWFEFGSEAFKARLIERIDADNILKSRELYYIEKFNSIKTGYNVSENTGIKQNILSELKESYAEYINNKIFNLQPSIPSYWKFDVKREKVEIDLYKVLPIVHKHFEFYVLPKIKHYKNIVAKTIVETMYKRNNIYFSIVYLRKENSTAVMKFALSDILKTKKDKKCGLDKAVKFCVDNPKFNFHWED